MGALRTMRQPWYPIAILLLVLARGGGDAQAQSISAHLSGVVRTEDGTPVADSTVQARATTTGIVRTTLTDEQGRFVFDALAPGRWEIVVTSPAGQPSGAQTVVLGVGQRAQLEFQVLGELREQVDVSSETPLIDASRSWNELRVSRETVDDLPINGRTVTDLALLDSGVVATPAGTLYGERAAVFALGGQSGRANAFLVDGLDNGDRASSTTLNSYFSQQVIKEFVVLKHQYAAEFGRAGGGVMNIVTQRGDNQRRTEFFVQGTSPSWNSAGDFTSSLPRGSGDVSVGRRAAGFTSGGPLHKDESFYFVAFEHQTSDDIYPFAGVTRDGTSGGLLRAPNRDDNLFVRTDWNLTPSTFLMVRLSADRRRSSGLNVEGLFTPESGFSLKERDAQLAAALTTVISPRAVHELRFLVGTSRFDQTANSTRPGVERPSGLFGGNNLGAQLRNESRVQLLDNLSWIGGTHTLKFGIDLLRTRTKVTTRFNQNGNFLYETDRGFEPGDCGDLLASDVRAVADKNGDGTEDEDYSPFTTPIPCAGVPGVDDDGDGTTDEPGFVGTYAKVFTLIEGTPRATFDDTQVALFAQDSWQVTPNLLLDYGLRYDLSTYVLPKTAQVASSIPNGAAGRDSNNVAPRLGFSWRPGGAERILVRGGAGLFYDKIPLGFPAVSAITSGTQIGLLFPQGLTFEITEGVVEQLGIDLIKQGLIFPENLTLRFSTGTELDTPYVSQFNLAADVALGRHGVLFADVVRALGYHQILLRDLNPVVGKDPLGIPIHRDGSVGSIAAIVSEGRTWYTGATVGYRFQHGTSWGNASYTWSQALDLGPDPLKGGISLPPDSDRLAAERGRADTDRRHRVVLAGGIRLPWWDLKLASTIQYASDLPFNVTTGRDDNLDGQTNDRPAGIGRNSGETTPLGPVNRLRAEEGLDPVRKLNEVDFLQVDLRVARPITFGAAKGHGELFVQVFNLFDRFNGALVDGRIVSHRFGQPLGLAGPPRTLELGLKFGF